MRRDSDRIRWPFSSRRRIADDVRRELHLHLELRTAALEQSGMSAEAARAQALREFGDLEDATRYCIEVDHEAARRRRVRDWWSDVRQDVRHTLRVLRRTPGFALATVLTLAAGLGASTAVYGVVHAYLLRPLPYPDADRLMFVMDGPTDERLPDMPSLSNVDWGVTDSVFAAAARWNLDGFSIPGEPYAEVVTGAWVSPGFFETLSLRPALGRTFLASEYETGAPVALLSHGLWMRRFGGDSSLVGRAIRIASVEDPGATSLVTIVGVTPADFWPIHWRESELLRPLQESTPSMPALVRLERGVTVAAAQQQLTAVVRAQLAGPVDSRWHMRLVPALERHSARVKRLLLTIFGAALFMLLAACGSVAGAQVSRMAARRNELAVRLSLGGTRARVVRQVLTESAVVGTLAGVLGLALAFVLLDAGGALIERQLGTRSPGGYQALAPGAAVLLPAAIAGTLCGVLLGLIPALMLVRPHFTPLTGGTRSDAGRGGVLRMRRVLIAAQVALATVLLFGAGLMLRTTARIANADLGFRADGLLAGTVTLPGDSYADTDARRAGMARILSTIAGTEGVQQAATVFPGPFWNVGGFHVFAEGEPIDSAASPRASVYTVSPSYFETMAIPVHRGRTFHDLDTEAAPLVVVVSERLAQRLAVHGDPIGRRIRVRVPHSANWDDQDTLPWRTIVGVVGDTRKSFTSDAPDTPDLYVPYSQNARSWQSIVVRTDRVEDGMIEPLKRAVGSADPALAFGNVRPVIAVAEEATGQRAGLTALLGVFAGFAMLLSALALFASLSYTVVQRNSELAVRMAVGASAHRIMGLVLGEAMVTAGAGMVAGVLLSIALGRVLASQLYGVAPRDPLTLAAVTVLLTVATLAACTVPALRATRVAPARVLRN